VKNASAAVQSLAQLLEQQPAAAPACLVEPGLLPPQGILFVGGEPKVGKSLLVANLALSLAAGANRMGFPVPSARRVLVCQFELPVAQFVSRLAVMRRAVGAAADEHLLVDTRASGHLLSAAQGLGQSFCGGSQGRRRGGHRSRSALLDARSGRKRYACHGFLVSIAVAVARRLARRAGGGASCAQIHRTP
jgi:hypothetical protein